LPYNLLLVFLLPTLGIPLAYLTAKKSSKAAAFLVAAIAIINIGLILATIPEIMSQAVYMESYHWIPILNAQFTLFVDGISASIALISLILIVAAALFSINYMEGKKNLPVYYALLNMLSIGLVGVFITSNLLLFYFCWELMLVPAYFIIGGWGYRESYRAAFKFFIFTHFGAVFVLLGIGAIYMITGYTDIFTAQAALMNFPDVSRWILLALTAGFAVKMAVVPVHMWLPDAHSEAPATMSALLSGIIISAGAYAILRLSLGTVFPTVAGTEFGVTFLHGLAVFGIISAFFGSFIALVETDVKRIIAYSSISHMGYVMFGLSLYSSSPITGTLAITAAIVGTVMHIINHAVSKGLFFLSAGAIMHQTEIRNINDMGGLAGKMPFTGAASIAAALSIAGSPPFACFVSEFLIFVGAFEVISIDGFYTIPTIFLLIATVLSLAYCLRFLYRVFLSQSRSKSAESGEEKKIVDVPIYMKLAMGILVLFVIILGIYPTFFINLIHTVALI
jgi:NADH-quinone oxidoreductase subunit M